MGIEAKKGKELDLGSKILIYCCIACTSIFGAVAMTLGIIELYQGDLPPAVGLMMLGLIVLGTSYYMYRELR